MSTVTALKKALCDGLEEKGVINELKAKLRAEVFSALEDSSISKPSLSNENMLLNELIRDYLLFNNYKYAESVLTAESGQPKTPLERQFLCNELNIEDTSSTKDIPLLYLILNAFTNKDVSIVCKPSVAENSEVSQSKSRTADVNKEGLITI